MHGIKASAAVLICLSRDFCMLSMGLYRQWQLFDVYLNWIINRHIKYRPKYYVVLCSCTYVLCLMSCFCGLLSEIKVIELNCILIECVSYFCQWLQHNDNNNKKYSSVTSRVAALTTLTSVLFSYKLDVYFALIIACWRACTWLHYDITYQ